MNPKPRPIHPKPPPASEKIAKPTALPASAFSPGGSEAPADWNRYAASRLKQFAAAR